MYKLILCFVALSYIMHANADDLVLSNSDIDEIQTILTATRLVTSQRDAPASVSVITAADIEKFRFRSVPEALKTIPGFFVGESHISYEYYLVGYHGGNSSVPRRTNVVIDGVSYYESGLSRVFWEKLPVVMSEISTIEVIRGPAASLYGSNSFTATVNITTKSPNETLGGINSKGVLLEGRVGQLGERDASLSYSSVSNDLVYRVNFSHMHNDGFDITQNGTPRRDSMWVNNFNFRGEYSLGDTQTLEFGLSHTNHNQQEQFIANIQTSFPDYKHTSNSGMIKYVDDLSSKHNLQIQTSFRTFEQVQSWEASLPAFLTSPALEQLYIINQDYANAIIAGRNPIGLGGGAQADQQALLTLQEIGSIGAEAFELLEVTVPQNYEDDNYTIEIQDTYVYSNSLRLLSGASITYVDTASDNWVINGERSLTIYRLFANAEYKVTPNLLINGGAMYEYDKESSGSLSPRLSLAYHLSDKHTLRVVFSKAQRPPDIFEQFANWRLIGRDYSRNPWPFDLDFLTFYARGISPGDLEPEKIDSYEVGYLYLDPFTKTSLDIRLFNEQLTNLISEKLEIFDFQPTNTGFADKKGIELQFKKTLTDDLMLYGGYTYLSIDSVENEKTISVRHTTSIGLSYNISPTLQTTFSYYGLSAPLVDIAALQALDERTVKKPLDSLDITLQWSPDWALTNNLSVYLQSRIRNGNPEIEIDNQYLDRVNSTVGISVEF